MHFWVTNHHSYSQWVLKPVGLPTPCPTKVLTITVCSNLKYCNLQTLFTLFCDNKRVGSTIRNVSKMGQYYCTKTANAVYTMSIVVYTSARLWSLLIPPITLCSTRHTTFWEYEAFTSMYFAHLKSFCVHFCTVFWSKSNPSNPGFRPRPNPGLRVWKRPGYPGFRVPGYPGFIP